jgi:xanthine dehydrogenase accessory factor
MLIDGQGSIEGSITGGCVEADVVTNALEILEDASAPRLLRYGVSDGLAQSVGLMCGGSIEVLVHELRGGSREVCAEAFEAVAREDAVAIATLIDGPLAGAKLAVVDGSVVGGFGGPELLDHTVARDLAALSERRTSAVRHYGGGGEALGNEYSVHLHTFGVPPRLALVGAIDYSAAVAALAHQIGYRVVIIEAREAFLSSDRFSRVAEVRVSWPDAAIDELRLRPGDAVIVFSHDPKFDEPALVAALRSDAGYIGALGSRRTASERNARLAEAGLDADALQRVHSPCGLDIGAATPEEVAISIMAEVIAARSGRIGQPLVGGEGSIRPREVELLAQQADVELA